MEVKTLQKYLGMAVHFIYYHHHRLNNKKVFEDEYWEGLNELGSCNFEYLEKIVENLANVKSGELEQYDFGYEIYSLECRKEISQVIDTFNDWKCIAEIPTQEVYILMKNWRDYLIENS